ncbi:MAG: UGSC family (seleno)protein, partial [Ilumatobacteraceae bacterium]
TSCSVHDISDLEIRGVPGVFVASSEFIDAAVAQSTSLGYPTMARVFVPHPIQDRTDDEMRAHADQSIDEIVAAITSG